MPAGVELEDLQTHKRHPGLMEWDGEIMSVPELEDLQTLNRHPEPTDWAGGIMPMTGI